MRHNWEDDTYKELVQKARHLTDQDERMALYQRADKILMESAEEGTAEDAAAAVPDETAPAEPVADEGAEEPPPATDEAPTE